MCRAVRRGMGTREGSRSEEFGRLADAVRGRSDPLRTTTLSRIALNLRRLASKKESESREVQEDLHDLMILRTPVAQRYVVAEEARAPGASKKGPPPLPQKGADRVPTMASPPSRFPSSRVGLATTGGMGKSSVLFLVAIALAVLTMSAIALAVVVPSSEWAFLRG